MISGSRLLHWMIKQMGDDRLLPIDDLVLKKNSGELVAIGCDAVYLPLDGEYTLCNGYVMIVEPLAQLAKEKAFVVTDAHILLSQLLGKNIYDQHHQLLGVVGDCLFHQENKQLAAIEISQGLFRDLLAGRKTLQSRFISTLGSHQVVARS